MKISAIIFLSLMTTPLIGQGLLFDDDRYNQLPRQSQYNDGGKSEEKALEGWTQKSLKEYCPRIQNQGEVASCVGWSVGYSAFSIQQAILNGWAGQKDNITANAFSAMFIFNQIKITHCKNGSFIDSAMTLLQRTGDLYANEFDEDKVNCSRQPTSSELDRASTHKIMDFKTLFEPRDPKRIKINKTKLSLVQNRPVIIGMKLPASFQKVRKGAKTWFPRPNEPAYMGHAMTVIGFDDSRGAFEIMNSWSKDWGNDGFIWVKYDHFAKFVSYAFQMSLNEKLKKEKRYTASLGFRRFVALQSNGEPLFNDGEKVTWNGRYYQLKKDDWQTGKIFQLLVSQVTANTYLHVFSIDPTNEVNVHWPRKGESSEVTDPVVTLFVPGEDGGLQLNKIGKEHICILYSKVPILDFEEKIASLKDVEGDILDRLYTVFGDKMLSLDKIQFDARKMKFRNKMEEAEILPLVLQITVR
ncbi:MAG: C1 family peptidase [Bacteroidota bacterium]